MEQIKLFEMFAGYGGASFALKKAEIPFECVGYSEIDKNAIHCFQMNHGGHNFGDCSKIDPDEIPDFDLLTGGFPCQDVSLSGDRNLDKGRTNLYQEIIRIAAAKKPKYLLLENVKGLLSMEINEVKLHQKIIRDLQKIGYGVCWKVLNSKDYGIPQNRERIWFVCKLGGWDFMEFQFPNKIELKIFLKDILQPEHEIESNYYLSEKAIKRLLNDGKGYHSKINPKISSTLFAKQYKIARGMDLICHSLYPRSSKTNKGGTGHLAKSDGTSYCLDGGNCQAIEKEKDIRKLTPKECFRLMGFLDDDINMDLLSNTQRYKLVGNGWDINLVSKIFKNMIKSEVKHQGVVKE